MTEADVAYVHAHYLSLEQASVGRPESCAG
jgi:hypothetical protein